MASPALSYISGKTTQISTAERLAPEPSSKSSGTGAMVIRLLTPAWCRASAHRRISGYSGLHLPISSATKSNSCRPAGYFAAAERICFTAGAGAIVQCETSAPLQNPRLLVLSPKLSIKSRASSGVTSKGETLLRSKVRATRALCGCVVTNADLRAGLSGSVKFHTCSATFPAAVPWSLVIRKLPLYWLAAAVRGTNTSTHMGWFLPACTLKEAARRLPPEGADPVSGSTSGTRPSAYQPAPRGRFEPPQSGLDCVTCT